MAKSSKKKLDALARARLENDELRAQIEKLEAQQGDGEEEQQDKILVLKAHIESCEGYISELEVRTKYVIEIEAEHKKEIEGFQEQLSSSQEEVINLRKKLVSVAYNNAHISPAPSSHSSPHLRRHAEASKPDVTHTAIVENPEQLTMTQEVAEHLKTAIQLQEMQAQQKLLQMALIVIVGIVAINAIFSLYQNIRSGQTGDNKAPDFTSQFGAAVSYVARLVYGSEDASKDSPVATIN